MESAEKRRFCQRALAGAGAVLAAGAGVSALARHRKPVEEQDPAASYFTNARLTTHEGRQVRFYDDLLKGKMVVINMMYTTCSGICPANTASILSVRRALEKHVDKAIHFYSLSLRPEMDDARALAQYRERYGISGDWTFLTGDPAEVDLIRRRLGFYDSDPVRDRDLNSHTGVLRVGKVPLERWCMVPAAASTDQIVATILGVA